MRCKKPAVLVSQLTQSKHRKPALPFFYHYLQWFEKSVWYGLNTEDVVLKFLLLLLLLLLLLSTLIAKKCFFSTERYYHVFFAVFWLFFFLATRKLFRNPPSAVLLPSIQTHLFIYFFLILILNFSMNKWVNWDCPIWTNPFSCSFFFQSNSKIEDWGSH